MLNYPNNSVETSFPTLPNIKRLQKKGKVEYYYFFNGSAVLSYTSKTIPVVYYIIVVENNFLAQSRYFQIFGFQSNYPALNAIEQDVIRTICLHSLRLIYSNQCFTYKLHINSELQITYYKLHINNELQTISYH